MFNLNEEALKRVAREISKASQRVQEKLLEDAIFGERPPYSPPVSTATMSESRFINSITRQPLTFRHFMPLFDIIVSPYALEIRKRSRAKKGGFWQRLWDGLTDLNAWPYSRIEFYKVEVPAIVIDRRNNRIICHPSLEREIKKAANEGKL